MADHAEEEGEGGDIFVYMGGRAPLHVTHVRIDESVDVIEVEAFRDCEHLAQVETHDGIRRVGFRAFHKCKSLRRINLKSVVEIETLALYQCENLESVEFGDKLEIIKWSTLSGCRSLKHLKLPSIVTIESGAFWNCKALIDIELSERLETIEGRAFLDCERLQRIAIPLKRDLFTLDRFKQIYNQFDKCDQLTTVVLVGGIHKTVSLLHLESWRNEMQEEINRINQILPDTQTRAKTATIRQWMHSVLDKMDYFKAVHNRYVKEAFTLLELALWKAKLGAKEERYAEGRTKKVKVDAKSARIEKRITCGADIVIKNVLPFLYLEREGLLERVM